MKPETMLFLLAASLGVDSPVFRAAPGSIRHKSRSATYPDGHNQKFITVIGSRYDCTPEQLDTLYRLSLKILEMGLTGRSGCAPGADHQLTRASLNFRSLTCELYLPWQDFEGFKDGHLRGNCLFTPAFVNWDAAKDMASEIHPAWKYLSGGTKMLHTRNCYQILGIDLATPSEAVLCCAPVDKRGCIQGGTATGVALARKNNVPVFNIAIDGAVDEFEAWLDNWGWENKDWLDDNRRVIDEQIQKGPH